MIDKKLFWVLAVLAAFDLWIAGGWWLVWAMGHDGPSGTRSVEAAVILNELLASMVASVVLPVAALIPRLALPPLARIALASAPIVWLVAAIVGLQVMQAPR